ncbi:MAG: aminotransferase class V-fold PLP-dependent enzyme [Gammaproteobacteria bacterium]|nr:aminotransferase class V-fold PLP-dependent enzyme [Gammaproteobacteria bacterium]
MTPRTIDVTAVRAATPGCAEVVHFNNAGAALPPKVVTDAVLAYTTREALIGGYEAQEAADAELASTYDAVGALLGAPADRIALIENATRAWDMAFYGIPLQRGDRILTCRSEYASNYLAYLQVSRRRGVRIEVIPDDASGALDPAAAARLLDSDVKLISITHVPTNGGLVNPAVAIGELARAAGCYYLLDGCQSVGQMPIDVGDIGCDFLSSTGRKFLRGPRGTGFLYASERALAEIEPPFIDGRAATWTAADRFEVRRDARRFENWEYNCATRIGLGVAARYASTVGLDAIWERVQSLAGALRTRLAAIRGVQVCDQGHTLCGIVSFVCAQLTPQAVKAALASQRINVSVSDAAWTRLDMDARALPALVRASVHYYNTEEEVDTVATAIDVLCRAAAR